MEKGLPSALNVTYDEVSGCYYFRGDCSFPSTKQIELGNRQVILDVDSYGRVIGVELI